MILDNSSYDVPCRLRYVELNEMKREPTPLYRIQMYQYVKTICTWVTSWTANYDLKSETNKKINDLGFKAKEKSENFQLVSKGSRTLSVQKLCKKFETNTREWVMLMCGQWNSYLILLKYSKNSSSIRSTAVLGEYVETIYCCSTATFGTNSFNLLYNIWSAPVFEFMNRKGSIQRTLVCVSVSN